MNLLKIDEKELGCLGVIVNGVKNECHFPCIRKFCQSFSVVVPFDVHRSAFTHT
jgi:hypothetical protein